MQNKGEIWVKEHVLRKLPHSCGSVDGLQVFLQDDGSYDGWCYACRTYVDDPYKNKPEGYKPVVNVKSEEDIAKEIEEIFLLPSLDLPSRGLRKDSLEWFGVKVGLSTADGTTPNTVYFPYYCEESGNFIGWKVRLLSPKRMWNVGTTKGAALFGWEQAKAGSGKTLYITEGEFDAIALYQMMRDRNKSNPKYIHFYPAVVSLVNGSGSVAKGIGPLLKEINNRFENVVFVPDNDEAGAKASKEIVKLLPNVKIAKLPANDPNQCLIDGMVSQCLSACQWNAKTTTNSRIIRGSSLVKAAKEPAQFGISWPWKGLTKATRGIRRKEIYYFGAGVKMGKSEVLDSIACHLMLHHGVPILCAKPEQPVKQTYQKFVGKAAGRIFHDPNVEFDEEAFDKYSPLIEDKALILDSYQMLDWDSLKDDIRYAATSEGVKDIFIDPITCFTNHLSTAETNEFLQMMSSELAKMALDYDFTGYCFCHLNTPERSRTPHERGGEVRSVDFAGSRGMMRSCNYMIGIEGNKDPSLSIEERNVRHLVMLEDREFGCSDVISIYWNPVNGLYTEIV